MTVLTKPSLLAIKKTPLIQDNRCEEEVIEIHPSAPIWSPAKRSSVALVCMTLTALVVAITGITSGLMLYRQYLRSNVMHRFRGVCSIPINNKQDSQLIEPNYREMPLRWSTDPEVQVFSTIEDDVTDDIVNALREKFDIGDAVEKISVMDNGRHINFIHNFDDNVTGIIDEERCFMMDLDPDMVMQPELLVVGLEHGGQFDVTRVRSQLHAVLPALKDLARIARSLMENCYGRPVYRLEKDQNPIIRKRSIDAPPHDYIQFAGKHVQEIEINNLADILEYEQKNKAP